MPLPENRTKISLHVSPAAARNELLGLREGVLWLKVAAAPEKGKANQEVISFLSQKLGIAKGSLQIVRGHASRNKVIAIEGLSQDELMKRLSSSCGGAGTSRPARR